MMITLPEFLQAFPIPPLHHTEPAYASRPWVFFDDSSSSSVIHGNMLPSLFSYATLTSGYICQFWAPVTIGGRRLLSTSGQAFAVSFLSKDLALYRQYSENHKYNIDNTDVDNMDVDYEPDHTILGGGPATAFLNRFPCVNQLRWVPSEVRPRLNTSIMLPICLTTAGACAGVLELTGDWDYGFGVLALYVIHTLTKAGLHVFPVQDRIPHKAINGPRLSKDEITEALHAVCRSHNLALAQVWVAYEDRHRLPFSSSMKETRKKPPLSALKLAGSFVAAPSFGYKLFHAFCDAIPLDGDGPALKTLQDYESRYIPELHPDMLIGWDGNFFKESRGLTICLRSDETGDLDYVFEFIWPEYSNFLVTLEAILLTLKKCLPRFRFASGVELGDELDVKITTRTEPGGTQKFKIFQGKGPSPVMKEAAENLHGSESTLTIEAEYGDDLIEFHLPMSQPNFATLEKEIGMRLRLSVGTYYLEYLDEDGDWIMLTSDEDMVLCIRTRYQITSYGDDEDWDDFIQTPRVLMRVTTNTTKP